MKFTTIVYIHGAYDQNHFHVRMPKYDHPQVLHHFKRLWSPSSEANYSFHDKGDHV